MSAAILQYRAFLEEKVAFVGSRPRGFEIAIGPWRGVTL